MAATIAPSSGQRGWTIVDALLSLVFLGVLATVMQSLAIASLHALRVRQVADDLEETARIAVEIIARDIRDTGYGMTGSIDRGLRAAGTTRIRLARDLDLDGATNSANERIAYELVEETRQLRRQLGNASPQPMVDNAEPDQILFHFLDENGTELPSERELEAPQRAAVRQIEIDLRLSAPHPIRPTDRITARHRTSVGLRNAQL